MKRSLGAQALCYPTPVLVIGTYNRTDNRPNIAAASWAGICNSAPPSIAVSFREATLTHGNILHRKAFTINIPSASLVRETDYAGIASGRDEDKFASLGLTPIKSDKINAPYVQEFPLVIECSLIEHHVLGLHTMFIGQVVDVKAEDGILTDDVIDVGKLQPFIYAPHTNDYYRVGEFLGKAFHVGRRAKKGWGEAGG